MSESQASTSSASPVHQRGVLGDAPGGRRGPWLSHPVVDVVVGCGLCALPLALVSEQIGADHASVAVVVVATLALLFSGPHYAATLARAWRLGGAHRSKLMVASAIAAVVVVAAHAAPVLLPWLFTAYLTWSPWHYATQNHGIGLVLLARDQAPSTTPTTTTTTATTTTTTTTTNPAAPTQNERRGLKVAHVLFALAAIVATHAGPREALVVRAGWSSSVAVVVASACLVVGVALSLAVLWRLSRRGAPTRGLLLVLALLSTSLVWFVVPALLARGGALLYAGGVVALLHGGQHLWLTWFAKGRAAHLDGHPFDGFAFAGLVVAGGVALFSLVPWVTSKALGFDLVISLLTVQAVVNLHHYVVDADVWRLRDPAVRGPLFSGHERGRPERERVSNRTALLWSLPAVLLVLLGGVDVLQLAGTRGDAPEALAVRAAIMNDHDARVWVQSAQAAVAAGDVDAARADLGRAIALSPYNTDAQRSLVRLHVASGRDDDAWARRAAMPGGLADDPASLLLFAGVALRLDRLDDAVTLGRQALTLAGTGRGSREAALAEVEARRVVGAALLLQQKPAEARSELKRGLDDAQATLGYDPLSRGQLLELGLALADADVALQQADAALALYERCLTGAAAADRPDVAFDALTGRARVLLARSRPKEALDAFQRALRFVDDVDDPDVVAQAWLDYAALLARSEAPMRVRYACALKARAAAEELPPGSDREQRLGFISQATRYVEEVLAPDDAAAVRADVDAAAQDSLLLTYPDDNDPNP